MIEITQAVNGIRYLFDFTKWVGELRKDSDVLTRVNEAMNQVGQVQDKLYELRDENYRLQDENRILLERLRTIEDWQARRSKYEIVETPGGAIVLRSAGPLEHYACPSCAEKQMIQPLQNMHNAAASYRCPGCNTFYPVGSKPPPRDLRVDLGKRHR